MNKTESADLILKLYETRREPVMREARKWFVGFCPDSVDDILKAMISDQTSPYFRMVTTYWEMAAGFVNHGAIDEQMFNETNTEHFVIFSLIEPFLGELREKLNNPKMLANLEQLIMKQPDAKEMLAARRDLMRNWMRLRKEAARNS